MFYLECSDDESVNFTNNVSGFSHDKVALCQIITLRQVHTLSVTH